MTVSESSPSRSQNSSSNLLTRGPLVSSSKKLRDSCHACAVSKIKCHKEKPTCSRCAKRGTPCEYFATKRPGRKPERRVSTENSHKSNQKDGSVGPSLQDGHSTQSTVTDLTLGTALSWSSNSQKDGSVGPSLQDGHSTQSTVTDPMLETTFNWSSNFQKEGSVGPSLQDELSTQSTVTDPMLATTLSWSSNFLELPPTPASVSSTSLGLVSPSQADSGTAWDIASLSMPLDPKLDNTVMETGTGLESFISSPINFLDIETLSSFNFDLGHYDASGPMLSSTIGPVSDSEKSPVDHPSTPKPATPPSNDIALPTADTPMSGLSESDCSCLLQALDLMKDLSQADLTVCNAGSMVSPATQYTNCSDQRGNLSPRAVVLENKKAIQAISAMLRCSCSEDAYLLTLLSMIVLKMLERYALAVHNHSKSRSEDRSSNDTSRATYSISRSRVHSPHNSGPGRIAIQSILSELHRIQGLVNQLSPKMKLCSLGPTKETSGTDKKETSHKDHQASTFSNNDPLLPFSTTTMNRIEMDIRQSLSTLSSGIIKVLRHS